MQNKWQVDCFSIVFCTVMSYERKEKGKESDELLYDGSVTRYGPRASCQGLRTKQRFTVKCFEISDCERKHSPYWFLALHVYSPSSPGPIWLIWSVTAPVFSSYDIRIFHDSNNGAPLCVQVTVGFGFPRTRPSKIAFPPCANLAFLKICSKTGGDGSPGLPENLQRYERKSWRLLTNRSTISQMKLWQLSFKPLLTITSFRIFLGREPPNLFNRCNWLVTQNL